MSDGIRLQAPVVALRGRTVGNLSEDVQKVRARLEKVCEMLEADVGDGDLVRSIQAFQRLFMKAPDGRIDSAGETLRRLNEVTTGKCIVASLRRQLLCAYWSSSRVYRFDMASGTSDHATPPGYFRVYRKHREYRSRKYDAQMDYAMFFHRGYAIHMAHAVAMTSFLKYAGADFVGSHGCLRLSEANAASLFQWTPMGTPVLVVGGAH